MRVFASPYNPEAIGIVEIERGWGSLHGIEVRIFEGEDGAPLRIVGRGEYEVIGSGDPRRQYKYKIPRTSNPK